jgi:molybdopterin converting factor small subunit
MDVVDVIALVKELKQEINKRLDSFEAKLTEVVTNEHCKERMENHKTNLTSKQWIAIISAIGGTAAAIITAIKL